VRARAIIAAAILLAAAPARSVRAAPPPTPPDPMACGDPIDADEATRKARAKEHFDRGQSLYDAGEYALAIPEYRAAYCLVPDAFPVHNIAMAYERMVDYENAVVYFEHYIRLLPSTAQREIRLIGNRIAVLRRLPARIRVATDPPGAIVILTRDGVDTRGQANEAPLAVPAGEYAMRVELPGYQPYTDQIDVDIGQPYTYSIRLIPKTGKLAVTAYPADARIYVDGKIAGIGTFVDRYSIGTHTISVEATGRPTEERVVTIEPDRTATVYVKMKPARPRNGRFELLIAGTLVGLVDGLLVGFVLDEEPELIAAIGVGGGALGFATPLVFMPSYVPAGRSSLLIGATVAGAFEGLAFGGLVYGVEDGDGASEHERELTLFTLGTSLVFTAGAFIITDRFEVSEGDAALVNSGALWGSLTSVLLASAFDSGRLAAPLALGGVNLGLLAGGLLASRYELSRGHVALIDLSGFAGLVSALAISSFVSSDDKSVARIGLGGQAVGLIAGAFLTRNMDDEIQLAPTVGIALDSRGEQTPIYGFTLVW
jgi:hypothetical protein